jgi:selenocysteine-specific elongation factor
MISQARRILGTAGHIDHGKTRLVRAISGKETDRLKEEQERGISIELGFAHHEIDGLQFGIVDVPGHERFLKHMLAGAQGIDVVLMVVAADDGVMPQTEEHFDIIHLLGVENLIFVITKVDLVSDQRVAEVTEEIEILAAGTSFESAPTVSVSSENGDGVAALQAKIRETLLGLAPREQKGPFRMPIDRSFVLHGHGVVVTGTANSGQVTEGDSLTIRPAGAETRARTVQVHGERVSEAGAGQRIALNLAGVEKTDAPRGAWITDPAVWAVTDRFDCELEVRPGAPRPLSSFDRVRLHIGTCEAHGKIIFLGDVTEVAAKQKAFCQIALDTPILAARGDRFVIRLESANRTVGGGMVLHPSTSRHKPGQETVPQLLGALRDLSPRGQIRPFIELLPAFAAPVSLIAQGLLLPASELLAALATEEDLVALPDREQPETVTTRSKWSALSRQVGDALAHYHRSHPMSPGMDLESLRSRLRISVPQKLFRAVVELLETSGDLVREESTIRLPRHAIEVPRDDQAVLARLEEEISRGALAPPDTKQLCASLDLAPERAQTLIRVLVDQGKLIRVSPEIHYTTSSLERATSLLRARLEQNPEITVAEYRTAIGASRKYALALMDHFDKESLTVRVGDSRRLR